LRQRSLGHAGLGVAFRLAAAVVVAVGASSVLGYEVMARNVADSYIDQRAAIQRADVRALEALSSSGDRALPLSRMRGVLRGLAERPGSREVLLIDETYRIRVVGRQEPSKAGRVSDRDPRITAALRTRTSYAGHESDPGEDPEAFEFVSPVEMGGRRYALTVRYGHDFLDATFAAVRRSMESVALLGLLGGGLVFYLVGGRALLRSHRLALRRATRDGLTDMPNQRAFQDDVEQAVESATRHDEPLTLAMMDIDDFKHVNDEYGHPYGDAVLRRVADVLCAGRAGDRAYRLGGDEFALMLPRADDAGAGRLATRLSRSFNAAEAVVSIGLSSLRSGQSAEDLCAEADAALYETKRRGGNRVTHFNEIRDQVTVTTSVKTEALRRLIDESGITSAYQPLWDIDAGVLLGVEALMRPDPSYGISSPVAAFDIAERIGEIHRLDELCVRSALRIAPDLPELALLFVNLAPQTLALDGDGNDWLLKAAQQAGIAPTLVVIEVTERFTGRSASIINSLQRLRKQGFKLALDDVGTGNSGLEMLRQVEAEFVKIDRSIVAAAVAEPTARAVLMAMATYASQTNSLVIAEGIEDKETLDFLTQIDIQAPRRQRIITGGQGYGLGRPGSHIPLERPDILEQRPLPVPLA
jgi:diguanylate cyclase (GGDEF)-like protein